MKGGEWTNNKPGGTKLGMLQTEERMVLFEAQDPFQSHHSLRI